MMRAVEHVAIIQNLPAQRPSPHAQYCRESLHRTLAHFVACQRSWLPLLEALINGKKSATVKPHPLKLMETSGLLDADWQALTDEYLSNAQRWDYLIQQIVPESQLRVGHRTWTAEELTQRLIGHERHHLAEHNRLAP